MAGNDYLPKIGLSNINKLWKAYKLTRVVQKSTLILNNKFNIPFFKGFLKNLLPQLVKTAYKLDLQNYKPENIKLYLEGLLWCLEMYRTGKCSKFDYVYDGPNIISPREILYYLETIGESPDIPISDTPPIPIELYTVLTIPRRAKSIIPKKYHILFENQLKKVTDAEECETCGTMRENVSVVHKQKLCEEDEEIKETMKVEILRLTQIYHQHKKTHDELFSSNHLKTIINLYQK